MKNLILLLTATLISGSNFSQIDSSNGDNSTNVNTKNEAYAITDAEEDEFSVEADTTELEGGNKTNKKGENEEEVVMSIEEMEEVGMVKGAHGGIFINKIGEEEEVVMTIQNMEEVGMVKGPHGGRFIKKNGEEEGVDFESNSAVASIYPNPSDGVFTIRFDQSQEAVTRIEILDMSGRTVYVQDLGNYSGNYQEQVNLREFGTGLYMVAIQQGNDRTVNKVIVK